MKRALVIAAILGLTACSGKPKFNIGDCVLLDVRRERWESKIPIERIEEIGEKKYRVTILWDDGSTSKDSSIEFENAYLFLKVACPK